MVVRQALSMGARMFGLGEGFTFAGDRIGDHDTIG
jgi:hypothetical protein